MVGLFGKFSTGTDGRVSAVFSKYFLALREIPNYVLEVQLSQGGIEWRKGEWRKVARNNKFPNLVPATVHGPS